MANKTIVVELKLEDKSAVQRLGELEVAIKKDADELRGLRAEITKNGQATKDQVQRVGELTATLTSNRSVSRELRNELGGLTAAGLRFRDKMADATLEAIRQSGVLGQLEARAETLTAALNDQASAQSRIEAELKQSVAAQQASAAALNQLNQEYKEGKIAEDQYAASLDKVNAELLQSVNDQKVLNVELNKSSAEQTELQAELLKTAQNTEKLDKELLELTRQLKAGQITTEQFRAGVQSVNTQVQQASGAFTKGVSDLKTYALGFVGVVAAVQVAQRIIGDAVDTIVEFDQAINRIKTIGPEFAANIDRISEAARTVGIEFGFAATETAGAIDELGRAGLTVEQILGGGLQTALSLAVAGQISLADAAEATATGLNQFNLEAEESARVADSLVNGANAAQGGVGLLRDALNQSALAASGLGLGIEETVGALTTFAKAGLLGSDAGTSFRTMLIRLQNPTDESTKLLEQYNIEAFDVQGNFVGIANLAGQLQQKLSGLTQEQRAQALAQIFGSDALRAANVLYEQGEEGVNLYTEAVSKSGTAIDQAAKLQESQASRFAKLSASYKSAILALEEGSGIAAKSIGAATETLTKFTEAIIEAAGESEKFKGTIGSSYTELLGFFSIATGLGTSAIRALIDQLTDFDEKLKNAGKGAPDVFNPFKASLKELSAELKLAQDRQAAFLNNGKESGAAVAAEFQPRIDALQRIIAARKEEAEILAGPNRDQVIKAAKAEGASLNQLQAGLKALREERGLLKESDKDALKTNAEATASIEARIKATDGEAKSIAALSVELKQAKSDRDALTDPEARARANDRVKAIAEEIKALKETGTTAKNVAGSVADLNAQIAALKKSQEQATKGAQFDAYSQQIAGLQKQVDDLTDGIDGIAFDPLTPPDTVGLTGSTQEGPLPFDATQAQAAADSLIEIKRQEGDALSALQEEQRLNDLQGIRDFNTEQELLDDQFLNQKIIGQEEYNIRTKQLLDEERQLQIDQQTALLGGISNFVGAVGGFLDQGSEEFKGLATTQALINTYLGASQALVRPPLDPTPPLVRIFQAAAIVVSGLASVKKIQGFAQGGIVKSSDGQRIQRSNGDTQLITAKPDEVILTETHQKRLRKKYGEDIFAQAGVPGFAEGGVVPRLRRSVRGTALVNLGGVPRPSPSTIVQVEQSAEARAVDPVIYTEITEINRVNGRVAQITELSTA